MSTLNVPQIRQKLALSLPVPGSNRPLDYGVTLSMHDCLLPNGVSQNLLVLNARHLQRSQLRQAYCFQDVAKQIHLSLPVLHMVWHWGHPLQPRLWQIRHDRSS